MASRKPPAPACWDQAPRRALPGTSPAQLPRAHAPLGSGVRQLGTSPGWEAEGDLTHNTFLQQIQPGEMLHLQCKVMPGLGGKTCNYRKRTLCGCKPPGTAKEDPSGVGRPLKFILISFLTHKKKRGKK